MNFFSTVTAIVILTTGPALSGALAAERQSAPPAGPPAGEPASTPPSANAPKPPTLPPAPEERSLPAPADQGRRQTVEGVVESVHGSTMKLKDDTGRMIVVDLSRVSARVQEITTKGESVTVIGVVAPGSDRLIAQAVIGNLRPERDAPAALPRAR
jgi:hypothetical protein